MADEMPHDDVVMDDDVDMDDGEEVEQYSDDEKDGNKASRVYLPGISRALKEGEEMDFDPEAYHVFHSFETSYPCLSFDVVQDRLGDNRSDFPLTSYLVAGTQAEKASQNMIYTLKLANLHGMDESDDEDDDDDDDEEKKEEEEKAKQPKLYAAMMRHRGGINRVKSTVIGDSNVCAVWNDLGRVQIWNLAQPLEELEKLSADDGEKGGQSTVVVETQTPLHTFGGHGCEGFALGWSPLRVGMLASGDCKKNLHIWKMHEGGQWVVDQRSLVGHKKSVEDVAWSPTEESLLVSCSSDKTVRLWDTRMSAAEACVCTVENAHDSDVNVLSWNSKEPLIATGGDDAMLKVWSLKTIQYGDPVAKFKHHRSPITSVEWNPNDTTTLLASGEDDQTTIWDLAMETEDGRDEDLPDIPPQLMFIHCGQKEVKEVHWHAQIPGLAFSTMSRRNEFMDCKVYVGGLPADATSEELENVFRRYGRIRKIWVARRPPGFAFVEYEDSRDAEDAVRGLDGNRICGARARVELSNGGRRRGGGGGGGFGGGRGSDYGRGGGGGGGRRYSRSRSRSRSPRRRTRSRSPPTRERESPVRGSPRHSRSRSRSPTRSRSASPKRSPSPR